MLPFQYCAKESKSSRLVKSDDGKSPRFLRRLRLQEDEAMKKLNNLRAIGL